MKNDHKLEARNRFLDSWDLFGIAPSSFNFEGRENIYSTTGLTCTFIVYITMWSFFAWKIKAMILGTNPIVSNVTETGFYSSEEDSFDMAENGFMFAFAMRSYLTNEFKDDPAFV